MRPWPCRLQSCLLGNVWNLGKVESEDKHDPETIHNKTRFPHEILTSGWFSFGDWNDHLNSPFSCWVVFFWFLHHLKREPCLALCLSPTVIWTPASLFSGPLGSLKRNWLRLSSTCLSALRIWGALPALFSRAFMAIWWKTFGFFFFFFFFF